MIVKLFEKHLQDQGYILKKTYFPEITEYYVEESSSVNVLQVVDLKNESILTNQQLVEQSSILAKKHGGKELHVMTIVFYEDYEKALSVAGDEYMCWLIDRQQFTITPMENRIEDFYGLKEELTSWLLEIKELYTSGNINELSERMMNQQERERLEKRKKKKPSPVSVTLVVVNCIIFMTSLIIGDEFIYSGQMDSELVMQGQYYRFFTAMFLHAGMEHLLGNMLLLYVMGEIVENKTGSVKYGFIYLISGIMGNVISYVYRMNMYDSFASIGASGAVYGIMGALVYLVVRKTKGLNIPILRLAIMLVYCIYSSLATEHVDYAAHIGGLIVGFIVTALLCPKGGNAEK